MTTAPAPPPSPQLSDTQSRMRRSKRRREGGGRREEGRLFDSCCLLALSGIIAMKVAEKLLVCVNYVWSVYLLVRFVLLHCVLCRLHGESAREYEGGKTDRKSCEVTARRFNCPVFHESKQKGLFITGVCSIHVKGQCHLCGQR